MDAALRMFAARGYDGVSMRDLATELGIRAPSIYSHYSSKEDLLRAIVEPLASMIEQLVQEVPESTEQRRVWLRRLISYTAMNADRVAVAFRDPVLGDAEFAKRMMSATKQDLVDALVKLGAKNQAYAYSVLGYLLAPLTHGQKLTVEEQEALIEDVEAMLIAVDARAAAAS